MKRFIHILEALAILTVFFVQQYQASARREQEMLLWKYTASLETTLHDVGLGEAVQKNRPNWSE